jgi:enoyl-[acyl-carrier protein] reductase I
MQKSLSSPRITIFGTNSTLKEIQNMKHQLLAGKKGIIFGALDNQSIAWHVAEKCHEAGAKFTLTNAPVALRFGQIQELANQTGSEVIPADATSIKDLEALITQSMEILGGKVDFILHSIGMSLNVRKNREYTDVNHEWMLKTFDISALSFHKLMQTVYKMDAINEEGSIVALSYIAAQRVFPDYSEMAESKALLESFARSFGYHLGTKSKVRVNTISQSPTFTTAGSGVKGFNEFYEYASKMSPLGNASASECADCCVAFFSDLTKKITMQNIFHDGGFSSMGINPGMIQLDDNDSDKS